MEWSYSYPSSNRARAIQMSIVVGEAFSPVTPKRLLGLGVSFLCFVCFDLFGLPPGGESEDSDHCSVPVSAFFTGEQLPQEEEAVRGALTTDARDESRGAR
jgi:hypothetical protein